MQKGDTIGIVAPAGFMPIEKMQTCIETLDSWGYNVQLGETTHSSSQNYFSGTDEERLNDLQQMLDDDSVKAIMLGRGGYGSVRIVDKIDFTRFEQKPKWIIGFSDATVLHVHINHNYGIATIHSKMCNSFPEDFAKAESTQINSIDSIRQCLVGERMKYECAANELNRYGEGVGDLVGGNLSIIENLAGSVSNLSTEGKILFIEDVGEYLYRIDSMLWNLKRSKKLNKLKGLIVGQFRIKPDDPGEEFGKDLYEMVMEKVKEFHYPVCFNFPVGHVKENYALIYGVKHHLVVSEEGTTLFDH